MASRPAHGHSLVDNPEAVEESAVVRSNRITATDGVTRHFPVCWPARAPAEPSATNEARKTCLVMRRSFRGSEAQLEGEHLDVAEVGHVGIGIVEAEAPAPRDRQLHARAVGQPERSAPERGLLLVRPLLAHAGAAR